MAKSRATVDAPTGEVPSPVVAAPETDPVGEMVAALATTDTAPPDAGAAVAALAGATAQHSDVPTVTPSPVSPETFKRGPGRPKGSGKSAAPTPPPKVATGKRSLRDRLADAESEASALRAQVAMMRPDDHAVRQAREALQGTFTIAGSLLGASVHRTLDITPHAEKLAEVWAVPLAPHLGDIAENMPWIAAGLSTVVILLPVYRNYAEATAQEGSADAVPVPVGVGEVSAAVEVKNVKDFPRPMGAM